MVQRLILILVLFAICPVWAVKVVYELEIDNELWKYLHICIHVHEISQNRLVFSMPIWIHGSYYVDSFGDHVVNFRASNSAGQQLTVVKLSKNDWEVQTNGSREVTVRYDINPTGYGFVGEGVDSSGALIQPASTWMYIRELENLPVQVSLSPPANWEIATGLSGGPLFFSARDYHDLAD